MTTLTDEETNGIVREFTGVLLAGGQSRRFGSRHKAAAELNGTPFVRRIYNTLTTVSGHKPVIAINTAEQQPLIHDALGGDTDPTFIVDKPSLQGPVAGLYSALSVIKTPWLFVTGCDMPQLSADAIRWLSRQFDEKSDVSALIPVNQDGRYEPLHAFYRCDALAAIQRALAPDMSLKALVESLDKTRSVPIADAPSGVNLDASTVNVNTQTELRRIRRSYQK